MNVINVGVSAEYKKKLGSAIFSIALFITVFLALVLLSLAFAAVCCYFGLALIIARPGFLTLMVGGGLAAMGVLVFIFLVKFIFTRSKTDTSGMIEITRADEPVLFKAIDEIVQQVGTSAPKKTYLTTNVNAAVFYDSSFWSMFLPIKKNLMIGMGLIHSTTVDELKAVLSHEFGHFSQRSMKVGSYVYNVNKVIYNLLYENDSYVAIAQRVADINGYFSFFVNLAFKVVIGIQWLLRRVYKVVNLSYMGLSREMEFHADHVAASVVGSGPCVDSLLRLGLADMCFEKTIQYYNIKIKEGIKTRNLYDNHDHVFGTVGKDAGIPLMNGIPMLTKESNRRFQTTRIVIKDQWASHPDTIERVRALEALNIPSERIEKEPAVTILKQRQQREEQLTEIMFSGVTYEAEVRYIDNKAFSAEFDATLRDLPYDEMFNHYYDRKDPVRVESVSFKGGTMEVEELFGDDKVELVYESITLDNDIHTLMQISTAQIEIKSFDYNGEKFNALDSSGLILVLGKELDVVNKKIEENDTLIYNHFLSLARISERADEFSRAYDHLAEVDRVNGNMYKLYFEMRQLTEFIAYQTPFEEIEANMLNVKAKEEEFKQELETLLANERYQFAITEERRAHINDYLAKDHAYFVHPKYDDDALNIFYSAMDDVYAVLLETRSNTKRELLYIMRTLQEPALAKSPLAK